MPDTNTSFYSDLDVAIWAANRAREFERDRAKTTVSNLEEVIVHGVKERLDLQDRIEALELELETLGANCMKAMELKDKEIEKLQKLVAQL
jgi:hypothetical protein